jgi:sugar/nucleoside kinase (ribokinase family)
VSVRVGPCAGERRCDYLAVGHVTIDVIEDRPSGPASQPGGGAFYSALQAARLGLSAAIATRGVPDEIERLLGPYIGEQDGGGRLEVEVEPAPATTTLATTGMGPDRRQRLTSWAGPIERLPDVECAIAHIAPVARETQAALPSGARDAFLGLTPQGLVRTWDDDGLIGPTALDAALVPSRLDAVVFSRAELECCASLLEAQGPARGALVAMTAGAEPLQLRLPDGQTLSVETVPVEHVQDDLGAGDVFAAALFVAFSQGSSAVEAARYGSAAAAVRMGGQGPGAVGAPGAIETAL